MDTGQNPQSLDTYKDWVRTALIQVLDCHTDRKQEDVALELGLAQSEISRMRTGDRSITLAQALRLDCVLGPELMNWANRTRPLPSARAGTYMPTPERMQIVTAAICKAAGGLAATVADMVVNGWIPVRDDYVVSQNIREIKSCIAQIEAAMHEGISF